MATYNAYDPVTGELTYTYSTITHFSREVVSQAIDYDTEGLQPWKSYAVEWQTDAAGGYVFARATAAFDDGSSTMFENVFFYNRIGGLMDGGDRITERDTLGRVTQVYEVVNTAITPPSGPRAEVSITQYYDLGTGKVAFTATNYCDGRVGHVTHDVQTGNPDYGVVTYVNGRTEATDYDAATGRADYRTIIDPDGTVTATDWDLRNEYSWDVYNVKTAADGRLLDVWAS